MTDSKHTKRRILYTQAEAQAFTDEAVEDMLAALEKCEAHLSNPLSDGDSRIVCIDVARAAIAKAGAK